MHEEQTIIYCKGEGDKITLIFIDNVSWHMIIMYLSKWYDHAHQKVYILMHTKIVQIA